MKKILKSRIFIFVFGFALATGIGVYATSVSSSDVTYDNTNSGSEATTVEGAIDDLYDKVEANASSGTSYEFVNGLSGLNINTGIVDISNYSKIHIDSITAAGAKEIAGYTYRNGYTMYLSNNPDMSGAVSTNIVVNGTVANYEYDISGYNYLRLSCGGTTGNNVYGSSSISGLRFE